MLTHGNSELTFYHGSVSVWSDQLRVFEAAIEKHGCVDVVIGNAGINEVEDVFVDSFDEGGKLKAPTLVVLDVNIRGAIYTTKLALSFFRKLGIKGSLVLTGSAASYLDTPGIPVYNAAKHGVIGLVRSLRDTLREEGLVRVNVVAPWFTATPFTAKLTEKWKANGLPANQPIDVAWALLYVALNEEYNSKSLFVADGKYTELEDPIQATRNLWLGEQNTAWVDQRRAHKIKLGKQDA